METFPETLLRHGLVLARGETATLQVNTGRSCDLACRHCHHDAGPHRTEVMGAGTMEEVVALARRFPFRTIDVTGGSPENVPGIGAFVSALAPLAPRLLVRTPLVSLFDREGGTLPATYRDAGAAVVASLPSVHAPQTDAQRGAGTWERCVAALRRLNGLGFGVPGSGLDLLLASNPAGAFLPPAEEAAERRFRRELARHGVSFTGLLVFANVPLGRFRAWLDASGNGGEYERTLAERFNPRAAASVMCRTTLSVDWDGHLYDCDFHLAAGIPLGGRRVHVSKLDSLPPEGTGIVPAGHCFACTAGAGFTCGGAIEPAGAGEEP